jgi:hypothetical protein
LRYLVPIATFPLGAGAEAVACYYALPSLEGIPWVLAAVQVRPPPVAAGAPANTTAFANDRVRLQGHTGPDITSKGEDTDVSAMRRRGGRADCRQHLGRAAPVPGDGAPSPGFDAEAVRHHPPHCTIALLHHHTAPPHGTSDCITALRLRRSRVGSEPARVLRGRSARVSRPSRSVALWCPTRRAENSENSDSAPAM